MSEMDMILHQFFHFMVMVLLSEQDLVLATL